MNRFFRRLQVVKEIVPTPHLTGKQRSAVSFSIFVASCLGVLGLLFLANVFFDSYRLRFTQPITIHLPFLVEQRFKPNLTTKQASPSAMPSPTIVTPTQDPFSLPALEPTKGGK